MPELFDYTKCKTIEDLPIALMMAEDQLLSKGRVFLANDGINGAFYPDNKTLIDDLNESIIVKIVNMEQTLNPLTMNPCSDRFTPHYHFKLH